MDLGVGGLVLFILCAITLASLVFKETDVFAHDPIRMLVRDVLHDKVNRFECFITEHADVFLAVDDCSRLLHAILVVLLDEVAVFFRIKRLLIRALGQKFLSLRHICGFKLARGAVEYRLIERSPV